MWGGAMMTSVDLTLCGCCKSRFSNAPGKNVPLSLPCGDTCCSSCVLRITDCHVCRAPIGKGPHAENRLMLQMIASSSEDEAGVGDKRKDRDMDEYETSELLSMFNEKKKKENAPKLAELAVQQKAAKSMVDELKRTLKEAEAEGSRLRAELRAKERLLAEMDEQARVMEGRQHGDSGSSSSSSAPSGKTKRPKKNKNASEGDDPGFQIYIAAQNGDVAALRHLIETQREAGSLDAALSWEDPKRKSFHLQTACVEGHLEVVRMLIEADVDVNRINGSRGSTALMSAVGRERASCVRALLAVPTIDVNVRDKNGRSALAKAGARKAIRNLLIAAGATF